MNMRVSSDPPTVALIAGPTASGKSAIALSLAQRANGTIINADASQVYADLRILSARPNPTEEARAPHRLFGHVDGAETDYSAARWAAEARAAIDDSVAQGRLPILVGGTGLYLRTLIDGISPIPEIDPAIRAEVRALPVTDTYARLGELDPQAAAALNPADTTRIARALEVIRSTGRPIADWRAIHVGGIGHRIRLIAAILLPPRDWLDQRIRDRAAAMIENDAASEVRALLARCDIMPNASVRRAIGVAEMTGAMAGDYSLAEAANRITLATRQYAKRQYTWFRNQPPAEWIRHISTDSDDIIDEIEIRLRN
ncbi:MAG: tRNA (adenosine(37)-N6)-dimethylallyltransferase MiaA [Sphingomonas sp.]|jgi:tRNA dimethylallyltransferase